MTDVPILAEELTSKIKQLCYRGYQRYDEGHFKQALRIFYQAWLLLPKPQTRWREAGWVLTAIGDTYFRTRQYRQSCEALRSALLCPAAEKSPFVHLRLGQSLYQMGREEEARQQLHLAHQLGGEAAFSREPDTYYQLLEPIHSTSDNES